MIWVLLQSESPWQHNNAITFFILSLCFSVPGVFLRNHLREFVPAIIASVMAKFKQILVFTIHCDPQETEFSQCKLNYSY